MPRVLLVDDSPNVRSILGASLRENGFDVEEAPDAIVGAALAIERPPNVVVTDLWMPGISGVQLCRLLGSEARTHDVPVILVTAETGRRTQFWARCAGAAAYVAKSDISGLTRAALSLATVEGRAPGVSSSASPKGSVHERLSQLLDSALFESVVAGEVRALAHVDGEVEAVFAGLARLVSEIVGYRWLALREPGERGRGFLHAHVDHRDLCEAEAREALGLPPEAEVVSLLDDRALLSGSRTAPRALVTHVPLGARESTTMAMGPSERGASNEDRRLLAIVARELSGPLRIVALLEQARRLALTDPLTGLLNRRAFADAMNREIHRTARHGGPLSLLLLDIDHFKSVNDTHGHEGGDAVLKGVAATLLRFARRSDLVGRWGGEEFVVGLIHSAEAGARIAAERLRHAIAAPPLPQPGVPPLAVTASIGVATLAQQGDTLDAIVARADRAMYLAKGRGRNRVETG